MKGRESKSKWFHSALVLLSLITVVVWQRAQEYRGTKERLQHLGLILKMYANESEGGRWPAYSPNHKIWPLELSGLVPGFLDDPSILVASGHPEEEALVACIQEVLEGPIPDLDTAAGLMARSYAYIGYAVIDEAGFGALATAHANGSLDAFGRSDHEADGSDGLYALMEELSCCFTPCSGSKEALRAPGSQTLRPQIVEVWRWRIARDSGRFGGAYVLYQDGHVAWVPLGTFPVVPVVMDALCGVVP